MPHFKVDFVCNQRTIEQITVIADNEQEAIRCVEEGEIELTGATQLDSLDYSITDVVIHQSK